MTEIINITKNKVNLIIIADKKSIDNIYIDFAGNPKTLDEDFILREIDSAKNCPANKGKRKLITETVKLKAFSNRKLSAINKSENAWVKKNCAKLINCSVTTMLNNKGWK